MPLVELNWNPTTRQLRQFGALCVVALPAVGWLWSASPQVVGILAAAGGAVGVVSWSWPPAIRPLFVGLMILAAPIGLIVGELAIAAIFFGVFWPLGLLFRLLGRDSLTLKKRAAASYWTPKRAPRDVAQYYRQY